MGLRIPTLWSHGWVGMRRHSCHHTCPVPPKPCSVGEAHALPPPLSHVNPLGQRTSWPRLLGMSSGHPLPVGGDGTRSDALNVASACARQGHSPRSMATMSHVSLLCTRLESAQKPADAGRAFRACPRSRGCLSQDPHALSGVQGGRHPPSPWGASSPKRGSELTSQEFSQTL